MSFLQRRLQATDFRLQASGFRLQEQQEELPEAIP
jgi:hypothetical protein